MQAQSGKELGELERWLDAPGSAGGGNMDGLITLYGEFHGFAKADLAVAQALYRRVVETGGKGNQYAQERLLRALAASEDPTLIPFWREMIDFQRRPRDLFLARRRTLVLAALALIAIVQDAPEAYLALRGRAYHLEAAVRAEAIYYLNAAYRLADRPLPAEVADQMVGIATQDNAFAPRFRARALLRQRGLPVPFDFPGGVYYFDYGHGHQFQVDVTNIYLRSRPGKYPKMTESVGKAPKQYPD